MRLESPHDYSMIIKKGNERQEFFQNEFKINRENRFAKFIKEYTFMVNSRKLPSEGDEQHIRLLYGYKDFVELESIYDSKIYSNAPSEFRLLFGGNVDPNKDADNKPRDLQFQYCIGALLKRRGFNIRLCEPDFFMFYDNTDYAVAAKRVSSPNKLSERIREAERQIRSTSGKGIIALSVDNLMNPSDLIISAGSLGVIEFRADQQLRNLCKNHLKLHDFENRQCISAFFIQSTIPAYTVGENLFMYFNLTFVVPLADESTEEFMKFQVLAECGL